MNETTADLSGRPAQPPPKPRSSLLKKVLLVLAGLFVLAAVIVALAFTLTAGPVKAANAFFEATAKQGPAASYAMAAQPFRDTTHAATWDAVATQSGIKSYTGASWSTRQVQNDTATLNGSLKVAGGGALPIVVHLVKTASGWAVLSLDVAKAGVMDAASADRMVKDKQANLTADSASAPSTPSVPAAPPTDTVAATGPAVVGQGRPGYPSPELSSVSPPPMGPLAAAPAPAPGGVLGARAATGDGSPDMIPGAKVAGTCMNLLQSQRLPIDGVECLQPMPATPGASTRCVVRSEGRRIGMTVALRGYDPALARPALACVVDDVPLGR